MGHSGGPRAAIKLEMKYCFPAPGRSPNSFSDASFRIRSSFHSGTLGPFKSATATVSVFPFRHICTVDGAPSADGHLRRFASKSLGRAERHRPDYLDLSPSAIPTPWLLAPIRSSFCHFGPWPESVSQSGQLCPAAQELGVIRRLCPVYHRHVSVTFSVSVCTFEYCSSPPRVQQPHAAFFP